MNTAAKSVKAGTAARRSRPTGPGCIGRTGFWSALAPSAEPPCCPPGRCRFTSGHRSGSPPAGLYSPSPALPEQSPPMVISHGSRPGGPYPPPAGQTAPALPEPPLPTFYRRYSSGVISHGSRPRRALSSACRVRLPRRFSAKTRRGDDGPTPCVPRQTRNRPPALPARRGFLRCRLLAVDLGLEDPNVGHIAVLLAVVQPVAHHKLVGDLEAGIVGGDGLFAAGGLIQQGGDGGGGTLWPAGSPSKSTGYCRSPEYPRPR